MTRALVSFAAVAQLLVAGVAGGQAVDGASPLGLPPGADACAADLEDARYAVTPDGDELDPNDPPLLGDVCPELAAAVGAGAWGESLAQQAAEALRANSFAQLIQVAEDYERERPAGPELAVEDLARVVDSLAPFEPLPELSLWDRAMQWLEQRLGVDRAEDGRFVEWLRGVSIPDRWRAGLVYALGVLIVAIALSVVVNELRLGGVFASRPGFRRAPRDTGAGTAAPACVRSLEELRRAPPARQPVVLLALILERLRARYASALGDSLTHRELAAAGAALGLPRRDDFAAVLAAAERVTYAGWAPDAADVAPVIARGAAVLGGLEDEEKAAAGRAETT